MRLTLTRDNKVVIDLLTDDNMNNVTAQGELSNGPAGAAESRKADDCCDETSAAMWADYIDK